MILEFEFLKYEGKLFVGKSSVKEQIACIEYQI